MLTIKVIRRIVIKDIVKARAIRPLGIMSIKGVGIIKLSSIWLLPLSAIGLLFSTFAADELPVGRLILLLVIGVTGEVLLPTMVPLAVKTSLLVKVELMKKIMLRIRGMIKVLTNQ